MKIRFLFILIIFFAGMATGIYISAPGPEANAKLEGGSGNFAISAIQSDEFAKKLNTHLHKALEWGKEAAGKTSQMVKEKIAEHQLSSDG